MDGQLTEQEIKEINIQLAHLTYGRKRRWRGYYPYQDIQDRLLRAIEQFVNDAPPANFCEEILDDAPLFPYLGLG